MAEHPELIRAYGLVRAGQEREGLEIIQRRAEAGDPDALFTLGDLYWRGVLVPADLPRGRRIFALAEAAGNQVARRAMTNLMASGVAGPRDWPGALSRLREEARGDLRRAHMLRLIGEMELTPFGDPARIPEGRRLSESPQVSLYPKAFTRAECDYLIAVSEPCFEPSVVVTHDGREMLDPIRTSEGSTMHWLIEDPATHAFNRRIAALTGTHTAQGESLQILRYRPGQQYRRHFDWLGPVNRRMFTALLYLNQGYEGGETEFSKAGFRVRGETGDVLVFRNAGADGTLDPLTEHAGLPVATGTKYLATRWIREKRDPLVQD
jgi:prolyl 4-hydroxylase